MQIKGLNAANLQSLANVLEIPVPKLIEKMILHFMDTLTVEQAVKLSGCESEVDADRVFIEIITPMLSAKDNPNKKFRVWYDEKSQPSVWVVDAVKVADIYHPFVGRYDFATTNIFTGLAKIGITFGVKPEEILLID